MGVASRRGMQVHQPRTRILLLSAATLLLLSSLATSSDARPRSSGWVWQGYKSRQLSKPLSRTEGRKRLRQVRDQVRSMARAGKKPVVVFDIDDTLVRDNHAGKSRALYGAVKYVKTLHKAGATIVYLTARKERARTETTKMLKSKRLPLSSANHLLMNDTRLKGDLWKVSAKPRVLAHGKPLAMYDNDFTHVRNYRKMFPGSRVFRVNTISRRKDPGGTGTIEVIGGFFMGRKK